MSNKPQETLEEMSHRFAHGCVSWDDLLSWYWELKAERDNIVEFVRSKLNDMPCAEIMVVADILGADILGLDYSTPLPKAKQGVVYRALSKSEAKAPVTSMSRGDAMNLPFHFIHDVNFSYGRLLIPLGRGKWLAWTRGYGLRVVRQFHNCTTTGIR